MFKRFFKSCGNNATANVDPGGNSPDRKENPTTEILTSTKISPEKVEFALEFVDTLATLETSLHTSDDPEEISRGAMKMACDFYQADWCGFLMVDLDLGLWTPYCWYNTNSQDRTEMLTSEYESATKLPRWITAMQDNTKVMLRDVNAIKDEAPEEYEVYARLKIQSVLAVPVKPRPVGFLAVRNPKRFGDDERMLRMLAYPGRRGCPQDQIQLSHATAHSGCRKASAGRKGETGDVPPSLQKILLQRLPRLHLRRPVRQTPASQLCDRTFRVAYRKVRPEKDSLS